MNIDLTYNTLVNSMLLKLGPKNGMSVDVSPENEEAANALLEKIKDTVRLRVTALDTVSKWQGPIKCLGVTIAKAKGRDSGAYIPDSVVFIKGGADSGGSIANWTTVIEEDSIFEFEVPKFIYEKFKDEYDDFKIEIATSLSADALIDSLSLEDE